MRLSVLRCKQISCRSGGRDAPRRHVLLHAGQQRAHLRVLVECVLEPGLDALPHPGQGLLFAARGQAAVGGLQVAVLLHGNPEGGYALPLQRADLHHLGVPLRLVMVGVLGVAVLAQQAQAGGDLGMKLRYR